MMHKPAIFFLTQICLKLFTEYYFAVCFSLNNMNCYRNHVISKDVISFSHTASRWFTCVLNSEKILYLKHIQLCNQHRFLNSNFKIDMHDRQFLGDCFNCSPSHKSSIWSSQTNADFPDFLYHIVPQYFFCFFHCKVTF